MAAATGSRPSEPTISCGVSTWISKPSRPGRQAGRGLVRLADRHHGLDLADRADLREGDHQVVRQAAVRRAGWTRNRSRVRTPRRRVGASKHLNRRPDEGRGAARRRSPRPAPAARRTASASSAVVAAVAVAVLEVEPQVLDRFGGQLGLDPWRDLGDRVPRSRPSERHSAASPPCSSTRASGRRAPLLRQVGGVGVGRHVDGVHRLPAAVLAGIGGGQERVGVGQALVESVEDATGQPARESTSVIMSTITRS